MTDTDIIDLTPRNPATDLAGGGRLVQRRKPGGPAWLRRLLLPFRGRASWRMAVLVFVSLLTAQWVMISLATYLNLHTQNEQIAQNLLGDVKALVNMAVAPGTAAQPITPQASQALLSHTPIAGIVVYDATFQPVQRLGEPVITQAISAASVGTIYKSPGQHHYEFVVQADGAQGGAYFVVVRVLSTQVAALDKAFLASAAMLALIFATFVTVIVVIVQHSWYIAPYLFLRRNLLRAAKNPERVVLEKSPYPAGDEIGQTIMLVQDLIKTNTKNLTQIKNAAQTQIHKLAYFDAMTGLPNRTLFLRELDRLTRLAEEKTGRKERFAVVVADLDHFKDFNDSMGHAVGDAILQAVGKRLRASLPHAAVVARCGEDEFAVAMPLFGTITSAQALGEWVQQIIKSAPYDVMSESFQVRASVGVATFPDNASNVEQVLRNADIALNRSKEEGRDCLREYLPEFDAAVQARFQMLRDLRVALEKDQLTLFYQPQFDLTSGRLIGAEALIRWFQPDPASPDTPRFISPAAFIPIAEQSGLIVPIGEWVMRRAFETAKMWHAAGLEIRMAINVSGQQFYKSDLVALTRNLLTETAIDPHWIELEITESVFMDDMQFAIEALNRLRDIGVELAIDDFGTGYSSLSYLRQFPVDRLKIDQSFIRNALTNSADAAIVRTIIKLCQALKLKVIAEGVETKEHEMFLREEGCDEVQGFRYAKPLPEAEFRRFVASYPSDMAFFDKGN
ncbi:MAG: bifunctional diguanylate cyclase/phosphodiesterase [Pseudomonadota bacterium]